MSLVVLTYRTIFAVVDVGCDFKIASNVVYVCEFVTNLLTEAKHICSCSVRKPVKLETSRDTTLGVNNGATAGRRVHTHDHVRGKIGERPL